MAPTTKNTRNAALLISSTLSGTYTKINKTHGLKIAIPTEMSDDTGHGQRFKTSIPGLQDFKVTLTKWYQTASALLETISVQKLSYYALIYYDYADPLNYYRCQVYISQNEDTLDLGQTVDQGYDVVLSDEDIQIIRNGSNIIS